MKAAQRLRVDGVEGLADQEHRKPGDHRGVHFAGHLEQCLTGRREHCQSEDDGNRRGDAERRQDRAPRSQLQAGFDAASDVAHDDGAEAEASQGGEQARGGDHEGVCTKAFVSELDAEDRGEDGGHGRGSDTGSRDERTALQYFLFGEVGSGHCLRRGVSHGTAARVLRP